MSSDEHINTNALALALDAARSDPLLNAKRINGLIDQWVGRIQEREQFVYATTVGKNNSGGSSASLVSSSGEVSP